MRNDFVCTQCPRGCGTVRYKEKGNGYCKCGTQALVARVSLHMWEEPVISGSRGSGTVFFSGCNLRCVFCQNYEVSNLKIGKPVTAGQLTDAFKILEEKGAHNINLVTPSHFTRQIIEAFEIYRPAIPVVYNSSGFDSVQSLEEISDYIDIWLPDFKYADSKIAYEYSAAPDYHKTVLRAIEFMLEKAGNNIIENDIMKKGVIIRHLILPGNTRNSIAVLDSIKENFGTQVLVSLMSQYTPFGKAKNIKPLNRKITQREYDKVCSHLFELGFDGYIQDIQSANESFIPDFNKESEKLMG